MTIHPNPSQLFVEKDPHTRQLVWTLPDSCHAVTYQLQWLNRDRPLGVLPCYMRCQEGRTQLCLDLGRRQALSDFSKEDLPVHPDERSFLRFLQQTFKQADEHLMPLDQFVMKSESLFLDPHDPWRDPKLTFWPVWVQEPGSDHPVAKSCCDDNRPSLQLMQDASAFFPNLGRMLSTWQDEWDDDPLNVISRMLEMFDQDPLVTKKRQGSKKVWSLQGSMRKKIALAFGLLPFALTFGLILLRFAPRSVPVEAFFFLAIAAFVAAVQQALHAFISMKRQGKKPKSLSRLSANAIALLRQLKEKALTPSKDTPPAQRDGEILSRDASQEFDVRLARLTEQKQGESVEKEPRRAFILVDDFVIGSDEKRVDFWLNEKSIAAQHVRIQRKGGNYFIQDLGSRKGSWLEDRKLKHFDDILLPSRCKIQLAQFHFRFEIEN